MIDHLGEGTYTQHPAWDVAGEYCDIAQSDAVGCPVIKVSSDGRTSLRVPTQGFVAIHLGSAKKALVDGATILVMLVIVV